MKMIKIFEQFVKESLKLQHYRDDERFERLFGISWEDLSDYLLEISDEYGVTMSMGDFHHETDKILQRGRCFNIIIHSRYSDQYGIPMEDFKKVRKKMKTFENRIKHMGIQFINCIGNVKGFLYFIFYMPLKGEKNESLEIIEKNFKKEDSEKNIGSFDEISDYLLELSDEYNITIQNDSRFLCNEFRILIDLNLNKRKTSYYSRYINIDNKMKTFTNRIKHMGIILINTNKYSFAVSYDFKKIN